MTTQLPSMVTICGRDFTGRDLEVIRRIISDDSRPCRAEIARRTCRELGWIGGNGRLKAMSCRVALLRLQEHGLLALPPPLRVNGNGKPYRLSQNLVVPDEGIDGTAGGVRGLRLRRVETRGESKLWNEAIERFHYLGYSPLPGAQQRYLIECDHGLLGAIGFGASAWKVAARDLWIGWSSEQRRAGLHRVVNNARFLLLPWVRVRNLASRVLAMTARCLAQDWHVRYGYEPVLLETFVERTRFSGACYRAANWTYVGDTKGRGKLDRYNESAVPVKRVFLRPLTSGWRSELCV